MTGSPITLCPNCVRAAFQKIVCVVIAAATLAIAGNTYSMCGTSVNFRVFGGNLSSPLNGTFASADSWQLGAYTASGAWVFTTWKSGIYLPAFGFTINALSSTTYYNGSIQTVPEPSTVAMALDELSARAASLGLPGGRLRVFAG